MLLYHDRNTNGLATLATFSFVVFCGKSVKNPRKKQNEISLGFLQAGVYKVPYSPPPGGVGIESSCWGRKSSGEEGEGRGRSEGKGREGEAMREEEKGKGRSERGR